MINITRVQGRLKLTQNNKSVGLAGGETGGYWDRSGYSEKSDGNN